MGPVTVPDFSNSEKLIGLARLLDSRKRIARMVRDSAIDKYLFKNADLSDRAQILRTIK